MSDLATSGRANFFLRERGDCDRLAVERGEFDLVTTGWMHENDRSGITAF
jgi:hypothetical protein